MENTKIDWCDSTWNPVTGCLHGCEYCYARNIAHRFGGFTELEDTDLDYKEICESNIVEIEKPLKYLNDKGKIGKSVYPFFFKPTLYRYKLDEPKKWKKGRNIFVCSMADLFGKWVPDEWIQGVFAACEKAPQHNYLFLTKNPHRYVELAEKGILRRYGNMWYGWTEVSDRKRPHILCFPYHVNTFVSVEPILDKVHPSLGDWIIVGAETGRRKDKVIPKREWIEQIVDDCRKYKIPLFMKSSLSEIWGEPLIQKFPPNIRRYSHQ